MHNVCEINFKMMFYVHLILIAHTKFNFKPQFWKTVSYRLLQIYSRIEFKLK